MPFQWTRQLKDLVSRVDDLESRVTSLEGVHASLRDELDRVGGYKQKTADELLEVQGTLKGIVNTLEALIANAENQEDAQRARALLRRARNNLTRAQNAAS